MNKGLYYPKCYALVSGGKDSLSAAQILHESGKLSACVALETGISTPDWKDFVIKVCADRNWPLEFFATSSSYADLVAQFGFPGPAQHNMIMNHLKGRAIRAFHKAHPKEILASGVRQLESVRRLANTKAISCWEGVSILAPIYDWTTDETWAFFYDRGFERAPAYSTIQISGDCLCGAYARKDELDAIRFNYPAIAKKFDALGAEIQAQHPKYSKWGWGCEVPTKRKSLVESVICAECGPRSLEDLLQ